IRLVHRLLLFPVGPVAKAEQRSSFLPARLQGLRHHYNLHNGEGKQMKKIFLMVLLAAFVSGATTPTLTKVLGFGLAAAYAQPGAADQGENNDVDVDADSAAGG